MDCKYLNLKIDIKMYDGLVRKQKYTYATLLSMQYDPNFKKSNLKISGCWPVIIHGNFIALVLNNQSIKKKIFLTGEFAGRERNQRKFLERNQVHILDTYPSNLFIILQICWYGVTS